LYLETYFKPPKQPPKKYNQEEHTPIPKTRLERSLILDEIIRREKIQADNASLESEYNNTMFSLMQQGVDLSKARGGRQGQRQISQAIAMESISRVVTRKALDTLKAIATGEYKPAEETPESQDAAEAPKEESRTESPDQQEKPAE
jgi:FKBP-type peptidyl-prolyl cis-trans isomerase (trigger factor)